MNKEKRLRVVIFFIRKTDLQILGQRKYQHKLGNNVIDYWFFSRTFYEDDKLAIKSHLKRTMKRVLGRHEKTIDYLGTFEGKSRHNAIFLVTYAKNPKLSESIPRGKLSRFYKNSNSTCKRMLHEVQCLMSVRYPALYMKFIEMRNKIDRVKLNEILEKEDPHERVKKPNRMPQFRRPGFQRFWGRLV